MKNTLIELRSISKSFDGEQVLCGIDLDIHDKEFVTLLGPSGCGKTTTLRIIGGFESPDAGDVFFDGVRINDVPPYQRQVNTVFQRYALFPHLNVFDNIAFGLRIQKRPDSEIKAKVKDMLAMEYLQIKFSVLYLFYTCLKMKNQYKSKHLPWLPLKLDYQSQKQDFHTVNRNCYQILKNKKEHLHSLNLIPTA